jgi:ubiquinone biosynthesis protein
VIEQVDIDLALLERVAGSAARRDAFARYDPVGLAREFATTLRGELDYVREGRNAAEVAAEFATNPRVHVPVVFWSHTCPSVITEERICGIKIDDAAAIDAAGHEHGAIARAFADAYLSMVFVHGFFHADPHPGNVFVEADGRIAFVDFGMVGVVTPDASRGLRTVLRALVAVDATKLADGLLQLGIACDHVDRPAFEADLGRLLAQYTNVPLERLRVGPLLNDLMAVVRAHQLHLPSDLALLLKTVIMCEGVAASLDPSFELVPLLLPYGALLTADEHEPGRS